MDPSPFSNFIHLTLLENADPRPPPGTIPLTVHSDWFLAGWSVDRNGTVEGTRIAARTMIQLLKQALSDDADHLNLTSLSFMDGVAADQGLSMMGYNLSDGNLSPDAHHPVLTTSVKIYVWAYGLQSRTSVLGMAVLIIGILCVLLRVLMAILGQSGYSSPRSLARLLVAALEHVPDDSSDGNDGSDKETKAIDESVVMAKVQGRQVSFLTK